MTAFDAPAVAARLEAELRAAGTLERAAHERAYLNSDLTHLGTRVPDIRRLTKAACRAAGPLDRGRLLALAEELWSAPVHERRVAAVEVLVHGRAQLGVADLAVVERMVREAKTWALVDALATGVAGDLARRAPAATGAVLDRWAGDDDFWVRRTALLALLPELRRGGGDFERFARYADGMLGEREFFIRKAIGWVLRDTSKRRPALVSAWLAPRTGRASGVTMREAVKYLPDGDRLMAAHRAGRPAG